ncbi:hypothetical protein ONZ45_g8907 [Pleurotus djamor]|nr:hypothetical protein ONZ45_g8907 [Pleurotus djamor]
MFAKLAFFFVAFFHVGTAASLKNIIKPIIAGSGLISGLLVKLGVVDVLDVVLNVVGTVDVVLGANCVNLNVLGGSCSSQAVCCQNVQFNGLINVGCVAIGL